MLLSLISRCVLREPQNGVFSVTKREFVVVVSGLKLLSVMLCKCS